MLITPQTTLTDEQKDYIADKIAKTLSLLLSDQFGKEITVTLTRKDESEKE